MLDIINKFDNTPIAVGGLTMGANFIAAALVAKAFELDIQRNLHQ